MKRLVFVYLSVLLGLAASPALAASQREVSTQSVPQSPVTSTTTEMNTPVNSQMPQKANSMREQTYRQYFPRVREGGNHQKPQYNS